MAAPQRLLLPGCSHEDDKAAYETAHGNAAFAGILCDELLERRRHFHRESDSFRHIRLFLLPLRLVRALRAAERIILKSTPLRTPLHGYSPLWTSGSLWDMARHPESLLVLVAQGDK